MARRTAGRRSASALAVPIEGRPDFIPSDYACRPATGWTASALWSAAWSYAYTHGDGAQGVARVAFLAYARAYAPAAVHADVVARLGGVDYSLGEVE
ncbi:hypothetical protein [Micromonospora sp. NPDC000729]|uniref:hypothetical protein n=1 Tax=Micromonospora sp. NPDC000729 TaxID=3364220 RepID=UPI0036B075A8